jgi:glycosyltransferase involved in cell wall biosynthesis
VINEMKIAIDGTILKEHITGTGFYIVNLIQGLLKVDFQNNYFIFTDESIYRNHIKTEGKNFHIIHKKFKSRVFRVFWQWFILPFQLKKMKIKVLHSPNYITPLFKLGFRVIVTVHDLTFILFPEKYTIVKRLLFSKMVPLFIRIADSVIAVSENTKTDILKLIGIKEEKVFVTYESFPEYYNNRINGEDAKKILKQYGINRGYILYVGMIEPRKNILNLLKAFETLDDYLDIDLVIVGGKGWYYKEIESYIHNIQRSNKKNKIFFTGYIDEPELKYFFKLAFIFVYPSLYEGFGLPPLQAMACGTPVITSNISSLPEVVGDAAITIDPENLDDLVENLKLLNSDRQFRNDLIKKGFERSKLFNLEKVAKKTISVYKNIN